MNKYAVNPATGEAVEFDGQAWKPVEKTRLAVNPDGEIAVFDGSAWQKIGRRGPVAAAPKTPEQIQAGYLRSQPNDFANPLLQDVNQTPEGGILRAPPSGTANTIARTGQEYVDKALLGGGDELGAAVSTIAKNLTGGLGGQTPGEAFNAELDRLRNQRQQFETGNPTAASAAGIAGTIGSPANLAGGEFIARAPTVGGQMIRGGVVGSGMGATAGGLSSEGGMENRLTGAEYGAAGGAAIGAALPIVGAAISPQIRPQVQALIDRGVTPTPGQILGGIPNQIEEKIATVVPGLGDMITSARQRANDQFNRAAYNEVLQPMGLQVAPDVAVGREGIQTVHQAISDQYNQVLANVTFAVDPQLNAEIQQIGQRSRLLAQDQRQRYDEIFQGKIQDVLQSHGGTLTGPQLQGLLSELRNDVMGYSSSTSHNERQLGTTLGEVVDAINDSLIRTNPMQAAPLQQANASFARLVRLERAAGSTGNDNGVFTPKQLQSAVKAEDNSARKNQFAQGTALMQDLSDAGRAVLADKFPNSGTPGRAAAALALGGGIGYVEPTALAASIAASLPYTGIGGRLTAAAMTRRGPAAVALRNLFMQGILPASSGAGQFMAPSLPPPMVR